ncbi:(2Fe-2S)-binding protein [Siminovitchia terrae]|uniref:(2Fe-2S)-binding protein n=1 Tax=Siminovitchia terrae TaxID=1914933 RepID=A0ABQ4L1P4_SIMTE|nr:(2Fe-2S)-binding protein [Siminovitchia terrae]GIN90998.1 (2Fe-2S)-binding protein [Siminovitchia terrae]GIN97770.1 (2Fe-2S)-binding protein [Siminovitchia terrae]
METRRYSVELEVNGELVDVDVRAGETLLHVLRTKLGLTGAKPGCLNGDCGACTVMVGGLPFKSCIMLAVEAQGYQITTIEGLRDTPIQRAFIEQFAFQCGYCTPGFIINCHSLLQNDPNPSKETIKSWLSSNICRCTSYQEINEAIMSVINGK